MLVGDLMRALPEASLVRGAASTSIDAVEIDSRRVAPGTLFCCLVGSQADGHDHAAEAVARGAVAVLTEHALAEPLPEGVAELRVPPGRSRWAAARASALAAGEPAADLALVGVTGTNGKTTVVTLLGQLLAAGGYAPTVIGTLSGERTTPAAPELHRQLAEARAAASAAGLPGAVAMEVSSHGLDQGRVLGIRFDVAVFTNLSHDHLDYHGTMEAYFEAKAALFTDDACALAVIWSESPEGRRLLERRAGSSVAVGYGAAEGLELSAAGSTFSWRGHRVALPLAGRPNLINALLAAEAAVALGIDPALVARSLGRLEAAPGRMQAVPAGPGQPLVLVDYAHTPAALESALEVAREMAGGARVAVVFGCGGDRDATKRPLMGGVAARGADLVVITTDNARSEDPEQIAAAVAGGAPAATNVDVVLDRAEAIARAVDWARPGDVVLIAGKGHETTQAFADRTIEFDDVAVARSVLKGDVAC
jgi:UDP-N-acetylmuramoyl-L-alanyl-D-glutamate--2,6-diaminopimelate ligase